MCANWPDQSAWPKREIRCDGANYYAPKPATRSHPEERSRKVSEGRKNLFIGHQGCLTGGIVRQARDRMLAAGDFNRSGVSLAQSRLTQISRQRRAGRPSLCPDTFGGFGIYGEAQDWHTVSFSRDVREVKFGRGSDKKKNRQAVHWSRERIGPSLASQ